MQRLSRISRGSLEMRILNELPRLARGRCQSHVRTLKHQYIYLNPADDGLELHENIKFYIGYYNTEKVHQTINGIPNETYKGSIRKQQQILTNNQVILV